MNGSVVLACLSAFFSGAPAIDKAALRPSLPSATRRSIELRELMRLLMYHTQCLTSDMAGTFLNMLEHFLLSAVEDFSSDRFERICLKNGGKLPHVEAP